MRSECIDLQRIPSLELGHLVVAVSSFGVTPALLPGAVITLLQVRPSGFFAIRYHFVPFCATLYLESGVDGPGMGQQRAARQIGGKPGIGPRPGHFGPFWATVFGGNPAWFPRAVAWRPSDEGRKCPWKYVRYEVRGGARGKCHLVFAAHRKQRNRVQGVMVQALQPARQARTDSFFNRALPGLRPEDYTLPSLDGCLQVRNSFP